MAQEGKRNTNINTGGGHHAGHGGTTEEHSGVKGNSESGYGNKEHGHGEDKESKNSSGGKKMTKGTIQTLTVTAVIAFSGLFLTSGVDAKDSGKNLWNGDKMNKEEKFIGKELRTISIGKSVGANGLYEKGEQKYANGDGRVGNPGMKDNGVWVEGEMEFNGTGRGERDGKWNGGDDKIGFAKGGWKGQQG